MSKIRKYGNFRYIVTLVAIISLVLVSLKIFLPQIINKEVHVKYTTDQRIRQRGYVVENHYVTTFDGYILNLHRIPWGKTNRTNGKVALFVHSMWANSILWTIPKEKTALAFILADQGYDVWLFNSRGTEYSNHTILNPNNDDQFWDFSWHEKGIHDLPVTIDYVLQQTNKDDLVYFGHSEGCTLMYVLLSTIPAYNKKIELYVHIGPVVFLNHAKSIIITIPAAILRLINTTVDATRGGEIFTQRTFMYQLYRFMCNNDIFFWLCKQLYYGVFGYSPYEEKMAHLLKSIDQALTGGSYKELTHYLQVRNSGTFRQFDYGLKNNIRKYGRNSPPIYDLSKVTAPGYLIYGNFDAFANDTIDLPRLYNALGNCLGKIMVPKPMFNHADFFFGKSAGIVNSRILYLLSQH